MEIVLQWLDEVDDLVALALISWVTVRRSCLLFGLGAALLVGAAGRELPADFPMMLMAGLALCSVLAWGCGGLLAIAFQHRTSPAT